MKLNRQQIVEINRLLSETKSLLDKFDDAAQELPHIGAVSVHISTAMELLQKYSDIYCD